MRMLRSKSAVAVGPFVLRLTPISVRESASPRAATELLGFLRVGLHISQYSKVKLSLFLLCFGHHLLIYKTGSKARGSCPGLFFWRWWREGGRDADGRRGTESVRSSTRFAHGIVEGEPLNEGVEGARFERLALPFAPTGGLWHLCVVCRNRLRRRRRAAERCVCQLRGCQPQRRLQLLQLLPSAEDVSKTEALLGLEVRRSVWKCATRSRVGAPADAPLRPYNAPSGNQPGSAYTDVSTSSSMLLVAEQH